MSLCRNLIVVAASTLLLVACAGQSQTYTMNSGQSVTMPKGTVTGAASVGDANALAQMITNSNANAMQQFDKLGGDMSQMQATQTQELQTPRQRSQSSSNSPISKAPAKSRSFSPKALRSSTRSSSCG